MRYYQRRTPRSDASSLQSISKWEQSSLSLWVMPSTIQGPSSLILFPMCHFSPPIGANFTLVRVNFSSTRLGHQWNSKTDWNPLSWVILNANIFLNIRKEIFLRGQVETLLASPSSSHHPHSRWYHLALRIEQHKHCPDIHGTDMFSRRFRASGRSSRQIYSLLVSFAPKNKKWISEKEDLVKSYNYIFLFFI